MSVCERGSATCPGQDSIVERSGSQYCKKINCQSRTRTFAQLRKGRMTSQLVQETINLGKRKRRDLASALDEQPAERQRDVE